MIASATVSAPSVEKGIDLDRLESEIHHKVILVIDDEIDTVMLIKHILMNSGIDVISAGNGPEALKRLSQTPPDVILLDLMLPDMDGWMLFNEIRKASSAPVLVVSALAGTDDIVRALQQGADDYVTKPFHPVELVARINRVTEKHRPNHQSQIFKFPANGIEIDSNTREVTMDGRVTVLPAREFSVLASLARRPGLWVDLATIAFDVWNDPNMHVQSRVKYLIFLLRSQLEKDPGNPRLILCREGLGYKLAVSSDRDKNKREVMVDK
jgi:two-component system, OmpR family, KDP operon response regulator KdpE